MLASRGPLLPLVLFALSFGLGCSGPATKGASGPKPTSSGNNTVASDTREQGEVGFAQAGEQSCMLHAQANGYFRCLSGSDGQCFHYGSTCTPKSSCMYDKDAQQHKLCDETQNGSCVRYGQSCAPAAGCIYNSADNRYHQCSNIQDGRCASFGETCQPAS